MWWTKSWDELSCHHVTVPMLIESDHVSLSFLFFYFFEEDKPPFFLWKQLCRILQQYLFPSVLSGIRKVSVFSWKRYSFNSTVLITFIFFLFLYEKMFCILPKKTVLYTHVSKCTMFLSLCWFCFINRMLYFLPSMLIICFCFNIISNPTPTNFWIVKLNTRTLNSEFYWWHIWFFFFSSFFVTNNESMWCDNFSSHGHTFLFRRLYFTLWVR